MSKLIYIIAGTRPEIIKLAPVYDALKRNKSLSVKFLLSGQHIEMVQPFIDLFEIKIEKNFLAMRDSNGLGALTSTLVSKLTEYFEENKPDLVIVHGDTTTTLSASLAAFYNQVPVHHVEAGLRTGNIYSPWPEEINRKLVGQIASVHYAPTNSARNNLLQEGIENKNILVTGNTVVDALIKVASHAEPYIDKILSNLQISRNKKIILVTAHRRENFETGLAEICKALKELAKLDEYEIVFPVHLNPRVRKVVFELLEGIENIKIVEPLGYVEFVSVLSSSVLVLTDSGGIQEEAPTFSVPVIVMRDTTERNEAIEAGVAFLVGTSSENIYAAAIKLLSDNTTQEACSRMENPFGDGNASFRISKNVEKLL